MLRSGNNASHTFILLCFYYCSVFLFAGLALSDEIKAQLTQHKQQLDSAAVSESPLLVKDQSVDGKADSRSRLLHRVNSRREAIARRSVGDSASSDKVVPDKVVPGNTVPSDKEAPDKELAVPDEKPDEKPVQNNDSGKR
jgi:hypothetical protein